LAHGVDFYTNSTSVQTAVQSINSCVCPSAVRQQVASYGVRAAEWRHLANAVENVLPAQAPAVVPKTSSKQANKLDTQEQ